MSRSAGTPDGMFLQSTVKLASQNTGLNSHWSVKHRKRQDADLIVASMVGGLPSEKIQARGPRFIVFYSRGRADIINIMGGAKGLVDAMVKRGLFIDDDPKHLIYAATLPAPKHLDPNIKATIFIGEAA